MYMDNPMSRSFIGNTQRLKSIERDIHWTVDSTAIPTNCVPMIPTGMNE